MLSATDAEFKAYIPIMYEISYKLMFRMYCRHRDQEPGQDGQPQRCPEIDYKNYVPMTTKHDEVLQASFVKVFV